MALSQLSRGIVSIILLSLVGLLYHATARVTTPHEVLSPYARHVEDSEFEVKNTQLQARDNEFDDCLNRGTGLQCRLTRWNIPPGTQWTDYTALHQYGWTAEERPQMQLPTDIAHALQGLGLATTRDPYTYIELEQKGPFTNPDGRHGAPTGAYYGQFFNPAQGALIATSMRSPGKMHEISSTVPADGPFPALRRWSDLVWLQRARQAAGAGGASPANLNVVLHYRIVTARTKNVIRQALQREGKQLQDWPGAEVGAETPAGKALLGTPHGAGLGWLLADHRVGGVISKRVDSIVIFATDPRTMDQEIHLAFKLGPI